MAEFGNLHHPCLRAYRCECINRVHMSSANACLEDSYLNIITFQVVF